MQFYPNCRIRFVRYVGDIAKTGTNINISKDYSMELPLLRLIDRAKDFVGTQLREFTALNQKTGRFENVPEYPEFAWLEGIVNAVTHREYALTGAYILVSMYDDHLEIQSPGKLPGIVTVDNIRDTRYARNTRISRVLTEFGYVRELNEGVKRIYSEMEQFFLDDPVYTNNDMYVKLTLKNNIVMRSMRQQDNAQRIVGEDVWNQLDDLERQILVFMGSHAVTTRAQLEEYTHRTNKTVTIRLNKMIEMGIIKSNGNSHDPKRSYSIDYK